MSMSVGGDSVEVTPMSDINTTPLVDVMLVLLIIFLIAVPVVVQTVKLDLPDTVSTPTLTKPENVNLSVRSNPATGECEVYWGLAPVDDAELLDRAVTALKEDIERKGGDLTTIDEEDLPEAHIRADVRTPWRCVGGTIFQMQSAGFPKVGFISQPEAGAATIERLF